MCAWEPSFSAKVDTVRNAELKCVKAQGYIMATVDVAFLSTPYLVSLYVSIKIAVEVVSRRRGGGML